MADSRAAPKRGKKTNGHAHPPAGDGENEPQQRRGRGGVDIGGGEFSEEELAYDINDFIVPGSDDRGNSSRQYFRIPPQLERFVEVTIASKRFPYKTPSDFYRHAVLRHAQFLHKLEKHRINKAWLVAAEAIVQLCRDDMMQEALQKTFDEMSKRIDRHLALDQTNEAIKLISRIHQQVQGMPESTWRDDWLRQFRVKFAEYLEPTGPAGSKETQ